MALEPYIDAHSHIWTPDVAHYPLAKGFTVADMQPRSFTAEELLAQCRPAGVGRVNLIQMSYYEFDNSYMLDMIKLYPDRFVGTGIVDPLAPQPDEAMRALRPKGVRAFRIAPNYSKLPPARWLEPAGYAAMFAAAAETKQALSCLIDPNGFPEVDRMCTKFPETTVIIDHLGRIGVDGTIKAEQVDALCALAKHPKVLVKVGAFYALGKKAAPYLDLAPLIRSVVHAFGAKRCMWETDCPFQVDRDKYSDSVDLIRTRLDFLTPEDRDWMLTRTAEQTLFQPLS
ncbi:Predicted metal-dependent hydrolase, TIM-barrel fold [Singulisphaera sp. GP187]|uniref:amidohydrolase family protein n=1 Tax=Singulisphaera sp. GP187 TaxID=1882752 RepID=UPI00092C9445|nr:amidohydrolase family protein [Singulisphaera sp. GP187]SIN76195.1 Predicted metal-dependent hydrolase, TIM-barrel fold [Singulisphaera sp. GP187]